MRQQQHQPLTARWRLLGVIVLAAATVGVLIATAGVSDAVLRQDRVAAALWLVAATCAALCAWLLLASGLPVGTRLGLGGAIAGLLAVVALACEVVGTTLDGVPIVKPRGQSESDLPAGRQDVWSDQRIAGGWPSPTPSLTAPRRHWRVDIGGGFAGFRVVGGFAFTVEQRREQECVVAYHLRRGVELWSVCHAARGADSYGSGPRAAPAIDAVGRLFTLGADGVLRAMAAGDNGRSLWQQPTNADLPPTWTSPVLWRDLVIVGGRQIRAFDRANGARRWQVADAGSPRIVAVGGQEQLIVTSATGLRALDPSSGQRLWHTSWPLSEHLVFPTVALSATHLLAGGGRGGMRSIHVERHQGAGGWVASQQWHAPRWRPLLCTAIAMDTVLLGLDDGRLGAWDPATGDNLWRGPRTGPGRLSRLEDDRLLIQSEDGVIRVGAATQSGFEQHVKMRVVATQRVWADPVVSGPFVLVRGDGEAALWELPVNRERTP